MSLTQIAEKFEIIRQRVTKHVMLLENAGLINIQTQGRNRYCFPNVKPLQDIKNWVAFYDQFWDAQLTH